MTCLNYDRIYAQYRSKPKAVAWYQIIPTIGEQFCEAYNDIARSYDIDSNVGAQLDVIGRVVGAGRDIVVNEPLDVCEFGDESSGCNMGDSDAQMSETSIDSDESLSDEYYRKVLKSKVLKNTTDATIDDIIIAVQELAPSSENVRLIDGENMTFSLEIFGDLDPIERSILEQQGIVPKPQGVQYLGFVEVVDLVEFGNEDFEMGDEDAQMAGYKGA